MHNYTTTQKLAFVGAIIFGIAAIALGSRFSPKSGPGSIDEVVDKPSGELVRTTDGESEALDNEGRGPLFLGFKTLLDHGLTADQVLNTKNAFVQYSKINNLDITQVSVDIKTFSTGIANEGTAKESNSATFKAVINKETGINARINYSSVSRTELLIYDTGDKLLYASGVMNIPDSPLAN